ncbi:MAG TPA: FeoB-associated Cys-rich membrane protein [Sphingobacteriaceae bacterium]
MDINWTTVIIVGLILLALVIYLMRRNIKDERKFEKDMDEMEFKKDDNDSTHLNPNG